MSVIEALRADRERTARQRRLYPGAEEPGILGWLTTTNHKRIGLMYIWTTVVWLFVGGALAMVIRSDLINPSFRFLSNQTYNEFFTIHGTTMIFLVIAPMGLGLANYLVPILVGAPDMAMPRLNAFSYWCFAGAGLTLYGGFLAPHGAAAAGWTSYAPLSGPLGSQGTGQDMWIMGVLLASVASILTGINLLVTVFMMRAPGMTMWRLSVFTWDMVITSLLILVAFPVLASALAMLYIDRHFGGHFYDPTHGGSAVLYQHLFWFFGHPEVYIMALPFFGIVTDVIAVFSRKPVFGYTGMILASMAIAGLSMSVWAHHMFTTGVVDNQFFAVMSFLIAVPTGIKFFNWLGTMWKGHLTFEAPMLWCMGFMVNFLIGGITGVMMAAASVDYDFNDTYFIVAHFHYVLGGGSLFAGLAGITFWFPKIFGYTMKQSISKAAFWFAMIGFNMAFWPQFVVGLRGMPRRVASYPAGIGWTGPNELSTIGAYVMGFGMILFAVSIFEAFRAKRTAGDDPWGVGQTLEWVTSSPPPEHNFTWLPPIRSERPAWDWRFRDDPELSVLAARAAHPNGHGNGFTGNGRGNGSGNGHTTAETAPGSGPGEGETP